MEKIFQFFRITIIFVSEQLLSRIQFDNDTKEFWGNGL